MPTVGAPAVARAVRPALTASGPAARLGRAGGATGPALGRRPGTGRRPLPGHAAGPAAGRRRSGRERRHRSRDAALPGTGRRRQRRERRAPPRHGAGSGRRVPDGQPGDRAGPRRTGVAAAPRSSRRILDGNPRDDLGPVPRVHVRHRPRRRGTRRRLGRRGQQADAALPADGLRHGGRGLSGDLDDPVRGPPLHEMAVDEDRPLLPPADRGRVGVRLPGRRRDPVVLR